MRAVKYFSIAVIAVSLLVIAFLLFRHFSTTKEITTTSELTATNEADEISELSEPTQPPTQMHAPFSDEWNTETFPYITFEVPSQWQRHSTGEDNVMLSFTDDANDGHLHVFVHEFEYDDDIKNSAMDYVLNDDQKRREFFESNVLFDETNSKMVNEITNVDYDLIISGQYAYKYEYVGIMPITDTPMRGIRYIILTDSHSIRFDLVLTETSPDYAEDVLSRIIDSIVIDESPDEWVTEKLPYVTFDVPKRLYRFMEEEDTLILQFTDNLEDGFLYIWVSEVNRENILNDDERRRKRLESYVYLLAMSDDDEIIRLLEQDIMIAGHHAVVFEYMAPLVRTLFPEIAIWKGCVLIGYNYFITIRIAVTDTTPDYAEDVLNRVIESLVVG